jgi:SAM-dependent methyltransferase
VSYLSDRAFVTNQYRDNTNLGARAGLHERFSTNPCGWLNWVFAQLDLPAQARILDLGCGPGTLWQQNLARIPAGWQITLGDLSPGMACTARERLGRSGRTFDFAVVDAQSIPLAGESLDAIVANHMLYHVPDRPKALAEIRRVLRPGGRLYAATNGRAHMRELWAWMAHSVPAAAAADWPRKRLLPFGLENGGEQLAPWFDEVTLRRYEDGLRITEVEPLVAYAASMGRLDGEELAAFGAYVRQELSRQGVLYITKETGLFVAAREPLSSTVQEEDPSMEGGTRYSGGKERGLPL